MWFRRAAILALTLALLSGTAMAQAAYPPGYPPPGYPPPGYPPPGYPPPPRVQPLYQPAQLDQMLAPIALYPDPLLTEILTAATYPYEIDAAAQWRSAPQEAVLSGPALTYALQFQDWDPSVKSLTAFPQVLAMMDQHLDWTTALGNAFLAQQGDVMDSIQRLRHEALATGTLISTAYATVLVDGPYIRIAPANPQYVYVPVYNPVTVYGPWPYPANPPIYWGPPPGLSVNFTTGALGFALGIPIVAALWDWGDWDWRDHDVRIHRDRFDRINVGHPPVEAPTWHHDPDHRRGVPYRDAASRQRFQPAPVGSSEQRRLYRFYGQAPGPAMAPQRQPGGTAGREAPRAAERRVKAPRAPAIAGGRPEAPRAAEAHPETPRAPAAVQRAPIPLPARPDARAPAAAAPPHVPHAPAFRPGPQPAPSVVQAPRAPLPQRPGFVAAPRSPTPFQAVSRGPGAAAEAARGAASRAAPPPPRAAAAPPHAAAAAPPPHAAAAPPPHAAAPPAHGAASPSRQAPPGRPDERGRQQ